MVRPGDHARSGKKGQAANRHHILRIYRGRRQTRHSCFGANGGVRRCSRTSQRRCSSQRGHWNHKLTQGSLVPAARPTAQEVPAQVASTPQGGRKHNFVDDDAVQPVQRGLRVTGCGQRLSQRCCCSLLRLGLLGLTSHAGTATRRVVHYSGWRRRCRNAPRVSACRCLATSVAGLG